jgi:glycosyltransferase involved in cell wall biosynthesis
MRILIAQNVSRDRNSGMSRIMGRIHDEIAKAGHTIEYFCSEDVGSRWSTGKFGRFGFPVAVLQHVRRRLRQRAPFDIVNVHEPAGSALVVSRAVLNGTKIVVTSHGLEERSWKLRLEPDTRPCERPSLKTKVIHPATVLWQARLALARADHVFCLNEEDRNYIIRRFGRGDLNTTRICPSADPIFGRSASSRDYGACRRILFAGTWLLRKGTDYLSEAFSRLGARHPDLELEILNPGIPEQVVKAGFSPEVQARVRCIVTRREEDTVRAFEEAHLFVLPSLFEGTPLTLLEAMWSGLPVLTTSTCGMKDVIEDGRNGLLIPVRSSEAIENGIERLMQSEPLRRALGQAASREASHKLRWEDSARNALMQYERMLRG